MSQQRVTFSVFTNLWKLPPPVRARLMSALDVAGIELPDRPGFQVQPEYAQRDLPPGV